MWPIMCWYLIVVLNMCLVFLFFFFVSDGLRRLSMAEFFGIVGRYVDRTLIGTPHHCVPVFNLVDQV